MGKSSNTWLAPPEMVEEVEMTHLDSYLEPKLGRNLYNLEKHKSGMKYHLK